MSLPALAAAQPVESALSLGVSNYQEADVPPHLVASGVVKEYAADAAAMVAGKAGIRHGLINLGGDIRIVGPQAHGRSWPIGIVHPRTLPCGRGRDRTGARRRRFNELVTIGKPKQESGRCRAIIAGTVHSQYGERHLGNIFTTR